MANSSDLKLISPNELDELLGRAQAERWSELALFGPADRLSQSREEWPDAVKVYRRVFQLSAYAKGLVAKLQPLTSLTSLNLSSNSIGEEGVSNLLEASASAPRADRVRQLDLRSNGDGGELLPPEVLETSNAQAILANYRRYRTALENEMNWLSMTVRQVLASRRWHRWRAWFGRYVR